MHGPDLRDQGLDWLPSRWPNGQVSRASWLVGSIWAVTTREIAPHLSCRDAGVPVSVLAHPVMPLINDSEESLDRVCAAAARNGASSFSAAPLFLKPCAAQVFLPFL